LRAHIDHCLEPCICVHNLQRGTIRRRRWHSWKVNEHFEEMVMTIVRVGEHVQTMGKHSATVVFPQAIGSVIAIVVAVASWLEIAASDY
jgi:hypothetical protein